MSKKTLDWMLLIAYCSFIFFLSSQSELFFFVKAAEERAGFKTSSFIKHVVEYAILGFLTQRAFNTPQASVLFSAGYGVSDEIHQYFVPLRVFSNYDLLANSIGGTIGVIFALILRELSG